MMVPTPWIVPTPTAIPVGSKSDPDKLRLFFSLPGGQPAPAANAVSPLDQKVLALKDAISQNPGDDKAWYQLGALYYQRGQKVDAVQCFEQVLRLKPDNQKLGDWLTKYKNQ
jgi:tetratricopeptide (TPR) repeat protein